jgi:hypothetical protein
MGEQSKLRCMKENIRSEQVNDVPLLLGIMEDMGI